MDSQSSGWRKRTVGETCNVLAGFGFPERLQGRTEGPIAFFKVGDISEAWKRGQVHLERAKHYITSVEAAEIHARPLPENTTVFAKIGAAIALNRRAILSAPALVDNNVMGVVPATEALDPKFLFHFMCTVRLEELSRATTVPSVRKSDVEQIELPLPPIFEQQWIVAEIEKHFTRLDAGIAALRRVQTNLKRYRASVLKAACEGRLVPTEADLAERENRDFESANKLIERLLAERCQEWTGLGKYKKPADVDSTNLPMLPTGWAWATMQQLGELARGKSRHRPRDDARLYGGRYPFIQTGDVRESDGTIRSHTQTYNEFGLQQSRLWPSGTLCITIAANIASSGILTFPACFPDSIVGFLHNGDHDTTRYVEFFTRTAKKELERFAPATAQKNINIEVLSRVAIPLPPLAEQKRIVAEVERHLSVLDEAEAVVGTNLQRAKNLRQSILQRAFSGKL